MRRGLILGLALALLLGGQTSWAAGSWHSEASGPRVAVPGRSVASALLVPPNPALAAGRHIGRVTWRFEAAPAEALLAWLCDGDHCIRLASAAGSSRALQGQPADTPLHFRFRLAADRQQAIQVRRLQLIVEYR